MANDITILSCPICNNPKLREYGNGIYQCDVCETYFDKDENIVLTEQEYLQTCTTEQLAEWLNNKIIICAVCDQQKSCEYFTNETFHLCPYHEGKNKSWEVWLKQPHTTE